MPYPFLPELFEVLSNKIILVQAIKATGAHLFYLVHHQLVTCTLRRNVSPFCLWGLPSASGGQGGATFLDKISSNPRENFIPYLSFIHAHQRL